MSSTAKWLPTSTDWPSRSTRYQPPTPTQKKISDLRELQKWPLAFRGEGSNCSICSILATPLHQPLESTRHAGNYFDPISIRAIFLFFLLQKLCQITWLLTGWKNFLYFRRPLRPEARGICHICHMVNPAVDGIHTSYASSCRIQF